MSKEIEQFVEMLRGTQPPLGEARIRSITIDTTEWDGMYECGITVIRQDGDMQTYSTSLYKTIKEAQSAAKSFRHRLLKAG